MAVALCSLLALSACAPASVDNPLYVAPTLMPSTPSGVSLRRLPPPSQAVAVAVYDFADKTGQHKPNDNFTEYSRAVTQGGVDILVDALIQAGGGRWFTVAERGDLDDLLQERQIIRATREQFLGQNGRPLPPLPPLVYAGVMLEGGIIAYESNLLTGGIGARYLGIGGSTEYRRDTVTVYLRASSTQNGSVLASVGATKDIYSAGLSGGVFKFVSLNELLEIETGFTTNEPPQLAVRQAIEKAVHALVLEGTLKGLWQFRDPKSAQALLAAYRTERDGETEVAQVEPPAPPGRPRPAAPSLDVAPEPEVERTPQEPSESDWRRSGRQPSADINGDLPPAERFRLQQ